MQTVSERGLKDLEQHEGVRTKFYYDPVGIGTIGVGFTWRSSAFRRWWALNRPSSDAFGPGDTMTRAEITEALGLLITQEYAPPVVEFLGKTVPQHVFDAMLSVVFNCGAGALSWKWAQAAKAGNYKIAADLLRTTAVTAQGVKLAGLVARRKDEANLLEKGIYLTSGPSLPADYDAAMEDGMLRRGERGESVAQLQKLLGIKSDGIFGHGTEGEVVEFQRKKGLVADGIAGPKTLEALGFAA